MPDALSKTIPIWSAVLNRALFPTETACHAVQLPPNYLGKSEESQIENRIDGFVHSLKVRRSHASKPQRRLAVTTPLHPGDRGCIGELTNVLHCEKSLKLDLDQLRQQLRKPIRVAWANPEYFYPTDLRKDDASCLFVLCSASKRVHGAEMSEGGYIQGAGDDSEGWAHGLTPPVFWANQAALKQTSEEDLPDLIAELIAEYQQQRGEQEATLISPTKNLYINPTDPSVNGSGKYDLVIDCNGDPATVEENPKRLNLGCASAKLGSRDLRKSLDKVRDFVNVQLGSDPSQSILITCDTGKDLSAGTLLAIVCQFYNDNGMSHECVK